MRIYLVRHGQSTANVDVKVHKALPDHAIPLSDKGKGQAMEVGKFLQTHFRAMSLGMPDHIRVWNSPYKRTRETAQIIMSHLVPLPIPIANIDNREHDNLCEQQFGLFDGIFNEETHEILEAKYPGEFEHYMKCVEHEGKYWARFPQGESRFDLAVRVHEAFGTFHRDADRHGIKTIIVVCHGLVLRAFTKQWLHRPYEWMDNEKNPGNCWVRLIDNGHDRGYIYAPESNLKSDVKYEMEGKVDA